jgi:cytochrome c-type biogenesis protein CcmE
VPAVVPIVVLAVGAVIALLAILASKTQHDYYKNVRDLKEELEQRLGLGGLVLRTTRGMGGARARIARSRAPSVDAAQR